MHTKSSHEKLKERKGKENRGCTSIWEGNTKTDLEEIEWEELIWLKIRISSMLYDQGNEHSGFIKCWAFIEQLTD
jgi:hypothetical protein